MSFDLSLEKKTKKVLFENLNKNLLNYQHIFDILKYKISIGNIFIFLTLFYYNFSIKQIFSIKAN